MSFVYASADFDTMVVYIRAERVLDDPGVDLGDSFAGRRWSKLVVRRARYPWPRGAALDESVCRTCETRP